MQSNSIDRSTIVLAAAALIATCAAAWPPLHLILVNANLASYYQENIGWHFFWTQRYVEAVPVDFVHPGQGVLFTLIQSLYYLLGKFLGLDLFGQITLFSYLTSGAAAVAMLLLALLVAFDRRLDPAVRAALVTTPLVMGLGGPQMFSYDVYPDYQAYAKVLFFLFGWRWLHHRAWDGIATPSVAVEFGVLAGLLGAFKVTYPVWAAGLLLIPLSVTATTDMRAALRTGAIVALSATASMGGSFLFFYRGSISGVWQFFKSLFAWGSAQSGVRDFAIDPFSEGEASLARLILILVVLCLLRLTSVRVKSIALPLGMIRSAGFVVAMACWRICLLRLRSFRVRPIILPLAMLGLTGFAVATAYWRGGGSSYFDAVIMVCILCVLAAATFEYRVMVRVASFGLAAVFIVWPAVWTFSHWRDYASVSVSGHGSLLKLADAGDWQRRLYNWNVSRGLPVYVLTPTNYETQGTIEDMIFVGFQNFAGAPTDYLGTLKALYPHIHFLYFDFDDGVSSYHLTLPSERVVFMHIVGKPAPDFPQLDQKTFDLHEQQIDRLLRGRRQEECYKVTHILTRVDIVSCVLSPPA